MYDCPYTAEQDPEYVANVLDPLDRGEGVACFVVDGGAGSRVVLYCSHKMSQQAEETSTDPREFVRAAQAIAIQREVRQQATQAGFRALVA
jgi:transposase